LSDETQQLYKPVNLVGKDPVLKQRN